MNKKHLFFMAVLGAAFILSGTSYAADIYVSTAGSDDNDGLSWATPKATIRNATLTASSGDSIWLAEGEYTGEDNRDISIEKNLTLTGQSTMGTVINCGHLSRAFTVSADAAFTLRNLTVKNGNGYYGGAIQNRGNLTVENCMFTDNTGDYGAVITNRGDHVTVPRAVIINSHFENNTITTGTSGGALYNYVAEMMVEGCTFINNSANNMGGAIYSYYEGSLTVRDSTFIRNSAENSGGAIHTEHGTARVTDSVFTENSASAGGAVFSCARSDLVVNGSSFRSNHAVTGGAIWSAGNITVTGSSFSDTADTFGGSLFLAQCDTGDTAYISGSVFNGSSARYGGAISADGSMNLFFFLVNSTFTGNTAWYGGALFLQYVIAHVEGCSFHANRAEEHAGAIRNNYGNLTVRNSTFTDNSAYYGAGAVGSLFANLADIGNSTFTGNRAETWHLGSAVLSYYTRTLVNFCRIVNNPDADVYCEAGEGVDARYNWWGSNNPDFQELTAGDVTHDPWMILTVWADPASVNASGTSPITADLRRDSDGNIHPAGFSLPVRFSSSAGVIADAMMADGSASSLLRNLNTPGMVRVSALVDDQVVNTTVTVRAAPAAGITVRRLSEAAAWVSNYYGRYRRLPPRVTIDGVGYSMAGFLDLLARGTLQVSSGNLGPLNPRPVGYGGTAGIHRSGKLYRRASLRTAAAIKGFIDINGRAPRYAATAYGRVSFTNLVLGYSRIMGFYGRNGRLPAYLIL